MWSRCAHSDPQRTVSVESFITPDGRPALRLDSWGEIDRAIARGIPDGYELIVSEAIGTEVLAWLSPKP